MDGYEKLPRLSFRQAVSECFRKCAKFSGRARRSEFWWWMSIQVICACCVCVCSVCAACCEEETYVEAVLSGLCICIIVVLTIPSLAVTWRRLHDTGRPGWLVIVPLVLFVYLAMCEYLQGWGLYVVGENVEAFLFWVWRICSLVLIVLCCFDSDKEENKYGPSPKYSKEEWASQEE